MTNRKRYDDGDELCELYGKIENVKFIDYSTFIFELEITTAKGFILKICVGGDGDDVYDYDPLSKDWWEHVKTHIQNLKKIHPKSPEK